MAFLRFILLPLTLFVVATAWQQATLLRPIRDWVPPDHDADIDRGLHTGGAILYCQYVVLLLTWWVIQLQLLWCWTAVFYLALLSAFCAAWRWVVFDLAINLFSSLSWHHVGSTATSDEWLRWLLARTRLSPLLLVLIVKSLALAFCAAVIALHL